MVIHRLFLCCLSTIILNSNVRLKLMDGIFYHDTQVRIRTVCFDSKLFADKINV